VQANLTGRALLLAALASFGAGQGCDGLSPGSATEQPGAGQPGAGAVTRQTHGAFFPIDMAAHAMADCNSCHGGFPTFKMFSCVGCHEHQQAVADVQHAGLPDYRFDSNACLGCHPTGTAGAVARADHSARFFPIDMGTAHANGQCADCHTDPADRKQFSCVGCHVHDQAATEPRHGFVTGYRHESSACLMCHPQGQAGDLSRADHAVLFPIAAGSTHGRGPCTDCHTDPADRKVFSCLDCHQHSRTRTDPKHREVASYAYDSLACLRCHRNGKP
jgi:hypothetical protein